MPLRFFQILSLPVLLATVAVAQEVATEPPAAGPPAKVDFLKELGLPNLSGNEGGDKVTFFGSFTVKKGTHRGELTIAATVAPEWHTYSITQPKGGTSATRLEPKLPTGVKLTGPFQPDVAPAVKRYPYWDVNIEEHEGAIVWSAPLELSENIQPESLEIPIHCFAQVCQKSCIDVEADIVAAFSGFTEPPKTPGEYHPDPTLAALTLKGHFEPAAVAPGGKARLVITATPNPGWHVYAYAPVDSNSTAKPTLIYLPIPPSWSQTEATADPPPNVTPARGSIPATRHHDKPVTWTVEITLPAQIEAGEQILTGYMGLQTCTDINCLPPHALQFRATLGVADQAQTGKTQLEFISLGGAETKGGTKSAAGVTSYTDVARLAKANYKGPPYSLWQIILFSLVGGFILNLMPCVLPVIGLKALSFVQQGGESRARILSLNVWFSAGLVFVFLVLASVAVFAHLSWGEHFGLLWFQVAMVVLVFAFALSFLGVWEVPIPGFAQSSTSSKLQQKEGLAGAFFKGVFTTLLATPCSGPFLGTVFGYLLKQPPWVTYLVFTCIGLGMTSPYLLIGAFPALVRWLPKPGEWMETVKQLMGFVLLGTVVYLFTLVDAEYRIATLALVVGVWFACWLVGKVPIYESAGKQIGAWVAGLSSAAAVGVFAFIWLGPADELLPWQPFSPDTLARHQREGKTVMIDFTADWCPTCKVNLAFAVNTPDVKAVVEKNNVVPLLADWSDRGPVIKSKLQELGMDSIPVMAIYPAGRPGEVIVLRDLLLKSQVVNALEEAGPSKPAGAATAETAMANPSGG